MAASKNVGNAFGFKAHYEDTGEDIPKAGHLVRNIIFGSNFLASHIVHFYQLVALDWVDPLLIGLDKPPFCPRFGPDPGDPGYDYYYKFDVPTTKYLVGQYVKALEIRRLCNQIGGIWGGRAPFAQGLLPGGASPSVTQEAIDKSRALLNPIRDFIGLATDYATSTTGTHLFDVVAAAHTYPEYFWIGNSHGHFLAYGVFEEGDIGNPDNRLLRRGRKDSAQQGEPVLEVNHKKIHEAIKYSWYKYNDGNWKHPWEGETIPKLSKITDPYSWVKAPRYKTATGYKAYETGPLSRMVVNGDYYAGVLYDAGYTATPQHGVAGPDLSSSGGPDLSGVSYTGDSTLDRIAARALEAKKIVDAMDSWLNDLEGSYKGSVTSKTRPIPTGQVTKGVGMTEAPRGALGHWIKIDAEGKIKNYQCVVPSTWNTSPKDPNDLPGPAEQSLMGTWIKDPDQPLEVLRVAHSFDFCTACAVHILKPKMRGRKEEKIITLNPTH